MSISFSSLGDRLKNHSELGKTASASSIIHAAGVVLFRHRHRPLIVLHSSQTDALMINAIVLNTLFCRTRAVLLTVNDPCTSFVSAFCRYHLFSRGNYMDKVGFVIPPVPGASQPARTSRSTPSALPTFPAQGKPRDPDTWKRKDHEP